MGAYFKGDIKLVEKVQRRATKLVPQYKTLSHEDRLRALKMPSLVHRRRRGDMIITYKLMTGKTNIDKDIFFKFANDKTMGHSHKIFKEHATKLPRCNTYSNRIVSNWNQLPKEIVAAISVDAFKEGSVLGSLC